MMQMDMLRYHRLSCTMFTDTLKSKVKSKSQNQYAQVYAVPPAWTKVYPVRQESEIHHTLTDLFHHVGVPDTMVSDGAKAETKGEFKNKLRAAGCHSRVTEPFSPWQNFAELAIREVKKGARRTMVKSNCPLSLWDDALIYVSETKSLTYHDHYDVRENVRDLVSET